MVTKLTILLIIAYLQQAYNSPLRQYREAKSAHGLPLLIPEQTTTHSNVLLTPTRVKKSSNILTIPFYTNLHVIPISHSNIHHSSIHTDVKHLVTHDNRQIPVISQTISHSSTNITHPRPTIPIIIPYPHHLVPLHDLSVIPLQKNIHTVHKIEPNLGHYRVMEKKEEVVDEPKNFLRSIYGGFGTSLYVGGHGAGHGFHVFGF